MLSGSVPEPAKATVPPCVTVTLAAGAVMEATGAWLVAPVTVTATVGTTPPANMPTELRTCSVVVTGPATVIGTAVLWATTFGMPLLNSQV